MTVTLHTCDAVIGVPGRRTAVQDWDGRTIAERIRGERPDWPDTGLVVAMNGRVLEADELSQIPPDGAHIAASLRIADPGTILINLAWTLILSLASYAYQKLTAPKPQQQERGEEESPTYAWDGIQTSYGTGFRIPIVYGEHDVGGQVIGSRVYQVDGFPNTEALDLLLVLSEGRIDSIGGIAGGTMGETDTLGSFVEIQGAPFLPTGIRVNGINVGRASLDDPFSGPRIGATASLRMGEINQSPIDDFPNASTVVSVNGSLDSANDQVAQVLSGASIDRVDVRLSFPGGLYKQINGGQPVSESVSFFIDWKRATSDVWSAPISVTVTQANRSRFSVIYSINVNDPGNDEDVTIRVTRVSADPTGGPTDFFQTDCTLLDVTAFTHGKFAYPGCALLRLGLLANEQLQGTTPNITVSMRGRRLRVYDDTFGVSADGFWSLPTSGNFANIWKYPPGRNPAWVLMDMLVARYGLGSRLTYSDLDLPSFRDWADCCDEDIDGADPTTITNVLNTTPILVNVLSGHGLVTGDRVKIEDVGGTTAANGTWYVTRLSDSSITLDGSVGNGAYTSGGTATKQIARYAFDGVVDKGDAALEAILQVLAVGRAVPLFQGSRLKVVYEYRDAHGRGTNTVAARSRMQLVNTANCEEFDLTYLDTADRPNVIDVQILNQDLAYDQDLIRVEDTEASGIQAPYELGSERPRRQTMNLFGVTSPRRARLEAIYAHNINRLVQTEVRLVAGIDQLALEVKDVFAVQHDVMRPHATESFGWRTFAAESASASIRLDHEITIDSGTGATQVMYVDPSGNVQTREISMADDTYAAGTALTVASGTVTVAKGAPVTVGFEDALVRDYVVTSITRTQDGKREIRGIEWHPTAFDVPAANTLNDAQDFVSDALAPSLTAPEVPTLSVDVLDGGGQHVALWQMPSGYKPSLTRVYVTAEGSSAWLIAGQTSSTALALPGLEPHKTYTARVAVEDGDSGFASTGTYAEMTFVAPEFPSLSPADVPSLSLTQHTNGVLLRWPEVVDKELDYYEIRRGSAWVGAEMVARTRDTQIRLTNVARPSHDYRIRARLRAGVYSGRDATANVNGYLPDELSSVGTQADLASGAAGTASSTVWDALGYLRLTDGSYSGTYESAQLDAGSVAERWWCARVNHRWVDVGTTVDELTWPVGSGEMRWRYVDGREPSSHLPGCDLDTLVDGLTLPVDDTTILAGGPYGSIGHHARTLVEVRFDTTGVPTWTAWMPNVAQYRTAQRMQMRLTLTRHDTRYEPRAFGIALVHAT